MLESVNVAVPRPAWGRVERPTGIDKRPAGGRVQIAEPVGRTSALSGDTIGNPRYHGGPQQAVYAYAREDLDHFATLLGRPLTGGGFGENLTTAGIDVSGALIGERWRIGDVELAVTRPRTPCATFRAWMDERGWTKTFTAAARPGAYLRVVTPGTVGAGDAVRVTHRPDHGVSVALVFRVLMGEPELATIALTAGDDLDAGLRTRIAALAG